MSKKLYSVSTIGATVCFYSKEKVGFLDTSGIIFWIDLAEKKVFSKMNFAEGGVVWLYVVKERTHVVAILPHLGEKLEDLPLMEPVEL